MGLILDTLDTLTISGFHGILLIGKINLKFEKYVMLNVSTLFSVV